MEPQLRAVAPPTASPERSRPVLSGGGSFSESDPGEWHDEQVAEHTHMSLSWVKKKRRAGVIPHRIKGRKAYYRPEEVRIWWAEYDERAQEKKGRWKR